MNYSANLAAFLRVIRQGESSQEDSAYRTLYGGGQFDSFADHPRQAFKSPWGWTSAAGAYQAMCAVPGYVKTDIWGDFIKACGPHSFDPAAQDEFAVWCIKRRHALELVEAGALEQALRLCSKEWASLPFSPYGQPTLTLEKAKKVFLKYGGTLASDQASVDSVDTSSERVEETPKTEHVADASEVTPVYAEALNPPKTTQYVPAGEFGPSEDFAAVPQEKLMATADTIRTVAGTALTALNPIAGALFSAFAPLAQEKIEKELARHTDKPEVAQQVSAAIIEAAKTATGQAEPIQAVAAAQRDPAVIQKAETSALESLEKYLPLLERMNAMEQANIKTARQFNSEEPFMVDLPWLKLRFIHVLSIGFAAFAGWFATVNWSSLPAEMKGAVITLMVIAGWNGVKDYWMGSSSGSDRKTTELTQRARQ